jgi:hypothetical protein
VRKLKAKRYLDAANESLAAFITSEFFYLVWLRLDSTIQKIEKQADDRQ